MTPTCIIADDEPHLARYLQDQLAAAWPALRVLAVAGDGRAAAQAVDTHAPDFAFLDIQMPGLTGLEVAQGIEGATRVVFVTAYDAYAVQAFDQGAVDYLLKPVTAERLARTVTRLQMPSPAATPDLGAVLRQLTQLAPGSQDYLRWVRAGSGDVTVQIAVADVLYFDAADKYTCVVTADGEKLIRVALAELEQQLDPRDFARIHRSTLVNLHHVQGTRRDDTGRLHVRIKGHPRELAVSRAYHEVFARM
ncbi:MAG: LytTR family DNA-binding domain-containing protein [Betaproteobacteria bacterium]|nr:LytTR family DNA-binding domain-containing protein [Betaproteobacteria bacterium]